MVRAKLTSKGQVTLPKILRDRLGLKAGDNIEFVEGSDGFHLRKCISESPFRKYRGFLTHLAGHTTDEIMAELRDQ